MRHAIRNVFVAVITLLVLAPAATLAAEFRSEPNAVIIPSGETITDDLYTSSGTATIDGTVQGDLYVAGGTVDIAGTVTGDVVATGGTVTISGTVQDDVRVAGGQVTLRGRVTDDVFAASGTFTATPSSTVGGTTFISAGQSTLAGTFQQVTAAVGNLTVAETARINGDLTYWSGQAAEIAEGAVITGTVNQRTDTAARPTVGTLVATTVVSALITILMAYLFLLVLPGKSLALSRLVWDRFWLNLLCGFLFLVLVPIVMLLLLASVVGAPLALLVLAIYLIMLYLANLVAAIAVGDWVVRQFQRGEERHTVNSLWWAPPIGVVILTLIALIPFIGWLAILIIYLGALGSLLQYDWRTYQFLRKEKQF